MGIVLAIIDIKWIGDLFTRIEQHDLRVEELWVTPYIYNELRKDSRWCDFGRDNPTMWGARLNVSKSDHSMRFKIVSCPNSRHETMTIEECEAGCTHPECVIQAVHDL